MKIKFDYHDIETISKNLDNWIVSGLALEAEKLKIELEKICQGWVDEQNNSQIIAINARIDQFEKMKKDSEKYKTTMDAAAKLYRKVVEDNMKLAKSL